MADQSHFSEDYQHIFLNRKQYELPKRTKKKDFPDQKKQKGIFTHTSNTKKGTLAEKASLVRGSILSKERIYKDRRLYFVIKFSDTLNWPLVRKALESLNCSIVNILGNQIVKVAIDPQRYESFVKALERERKFISDIFESTRLDKIDEKLHERMKKEPDRLQNVTIEVVDLSGLSYVKELENALTEHIHRESGEIDLGYKSETFAIFAGKVYPDTAKDIADKLDTVETISILPEVYLESSVGGVDRDISLASVISLSETNRSELPNVCVIDSGVNRNHTLLRDYISDSYDFSTNAQQPCDDVDGHGTAVAGVAVYGGSPGSNTIPRCKVIMVKGFVDRRTPIIGVLQQIDKATAFFSSKSKVFNLSLHCRIPNVSITKALDDMIYSRDVVVVGSAGNIPTSFIKEGLEYSQYPDYLRRHAIFFPGDVSNAITVGACTSRDSNFCRRNSPSPFTRSGTNINSIKPDVLEVGGNLNMVRDGNTIVDFNCTNVGVQSTSSQNPNGYSEEAGTSFSSPAVANTASNISMKYPNASCFLVKAILLSSCSPLRDQKGEAYDKLLQGFGLPDYSSATNSTDWRVFYLLQGSFEGINNKMFDSYNFLFPDNADRLRITIVCGKPLPPADFLLTVFQSLALRPQQTPNH
jgi:hypothetical protein